MAKRASFQVVMWVVVFSIILTNFVGVYKANKESQILIGNIEIIQQNLIKMSDIQLKLVESEVVKIRKQRELKPSPVSTS